MTEYEKLSLRLQARQLHMAATQTALIASIGRQEGRLSHDEALIIGGAITRSMDTFEEVNLLLNEWVF